MYIDTYNIELSNSFDTNKILQTEVVDSITVILRQSKPYGNNEEICRLCTALEFEDTRQVQELELCNNNYSIINDSKLLIPRVHITYPNQDIDKNLKRISLDNPEIVVLINSYTSRSIPGHFHAEIINYSFLATHSIVNNIMWRSAKVYKTTIDGNYLIKSGEIWLINDLLSNVCPEKYFGVKDACGLISTTNKMYFEDIVRNLKLNLVSNRFHDIFKI